LLTYKWEYAFGGRIHKTNTKIEEEVVTFWDWRWWNEHATQDKTNEEEPWAGPFLQS
jgi:hypothetical protein